VGGSAQVTVRVEVATTVVVSHLVDQAADRLARLLPAQIGRLRIRLGAAVGDRGRGGGERGEGDAESRQQGDYVRRRAQSRQSRDRGMKADSPDELLAKTCNFRTVP
jgi:hypothetical protein